jgi:hypothetical protein
MGSSSLREASRTVDSQRRLCGWPGNRDTGSSGNREMDSPSPPWHRTPMPQRSPRQVTGGMLSRKGQTELRHAQIEFPHGQSEFHHDESDDFGVMWWTTWAGEATRERGWQDAFDSASDQGHARSTFGRMQRVAQRTAHKSAPSGRGSCNDRAGVRRAGKAKRIERAGRCAKITRRQSQADGSTPEGVSSINPGPTD